MIVIVCVIIPYMPYLIQLCTIFLDGKKMDDKPKVIKLELFPAVVSGVGIDLNYNEVLVVVTDEKIYIATDDPTGRARYVVDYEAPVYDITGDGFRSIWSVILDDPQRTEIIVKRSNGCGCGSRLRGARMFRGVQYQRVL